MEFLYVVLFVCYSSYAYNRKSVPFSMPSLKAEGLDTSHAGLIISCQNIAFTISKFLAGVLSDRLNPNFLFATGIFLSGFATLAFSSSSSISTYCGLWFLNGLAQGCGWPSIAKILRQRASPSRFGTLWSLLSSSNNFSGSLSPFFSAVIIVHFGWRWNVFIAGLLTVFLGIIFLLFLPFLPDPPRSKIQDNNPTNKQDKDATATIYDLFLDPFVWLLSLAFMVVFCARTTTIDWGQLYLMEEKKHSQYTASAFTSSVETGGFVGRILGGYLTDWVIKRNAEKQVATRSKSALRMSVAVIFICGSIIFMHFFRFAVFETSSPVWIVFVGAFMGMSYYGPIAIFGIVSSESVPSHLSGSCHAIVSLFGNIGATVSGLPFSYIAKYHSWSTVFLILEFLIAGTLLVLVFCRNLRPKVAKHDKQN